MSKEFDWDQFEESPSSEFKWDEFEEYSEAPKKSKISLGFGKKKNARLDSQIPKMTRDVGRLGKAAITPWAGIAGDILSIPKSVAKWGGEKLGVSPDTVETISSVLTPNVPTSQDVKTSIEDLFPSLASANESEENQELGTEILSSLLIPSPAGKGKFINPKHSSDIYKTGKALGLTEKQIAPLNNPKFLEKGIGRLAGEKAKPAVESSRSAIGDAYEAIKASPKASLPISGDKATALAEEIGKMRSSLGHSLNPSAETTSVLNILENAQEKIMNKGTDPLELMNSYRELNKTINWDNVRNGKKILTHLQNAYTKTLESSSPEIAKNFKHANKLWAKSEDFLKAIGKRRVDDYASVSKSTALLTSILTGNFEKLLKYGAIYGITKPTASKISAKLLTDPSWQSIHSKIIHSMKKGSGKSAPLIVKTIAEKMKKDLPEEYSEIDWESLED